MKLISQELIIHADLDARTRQRDTYGRKDNDRSVREQSSLGQLQPAHVSIGR